MRRNSFLSILLLIFCSLPLYSKELTPQEAIERLSSTQISNLPPLSRSGNMTPKLVYTASAAGTPQCYVFNNQDGGFLLLSADDRVTPVLGIADRGSFDFATAPDNMKSWLQSLVEEISSILQSGGSVSLSAELRNPVEPLIKTKWDQGQPYNQTTPVYNGNHSVTGCVATAMAQVMNYYRWPQGPGSGSCTYDYNGQTISEDFSATIFDWDNMRDTYIEGQYSDAEANAVAALMRSCGVSVKMMYSHDGSGALSEDVLPALANNFGYTKGSFRKKSDYSFDEWEGMVYQDLATRKPLYYSGRTIGGSGHAFVCDGYADGLYHINWGWGGYCDGYFAIHILNPDGSGIGGGTVGEGFSAGQGAIFGLTPGPGEISPSLTARFEESEGDIKKMPIMLVINKEWGNADTFLVGVRIKNENGETKVFESSDSILSGAMTTIIADLSSFPRGEYSLQAVFKWEGNWLECAGEERSLIIEGERGKIIPADSSYPLSISNIKLPEKVSNNEGFKVSYTLSSSKNYECIVQLDLIYDNKVVDRSNPPQTIRIKKGESIEMESIFLDNTKRDGNYLLNFSDVTYGKTLATEFLVIGKGGEADFPCMIDGIIYDYAIDEHFSLDLTRLRVMGYTQELPADVTILSEVKGIPVTDIAPKAFRECKSLRSINMPSIIKIGEYSFTYCPALLSIGDMPELKEIGMMAFYKCSKLEHIGNMPNLGKIDWYTFYSCVSLQSITDLPKLKEIAEGTFEGCISLSSIGDMPELMEIGPYAFNMCEKLESIGEMLKLEKIDDFAFHSCAFLQRIGNLPELKEIGRETFYKCSKMEHIGNMPKVESMGRYAFYSCASLQSIGDLPELKKIGPYVFSQCNKLESIGKMPKVETIDISAFESCPSLQSIGDLPELKKIGNWAFRSCGKFESIGDMPKLEKIDQSAFALCTSLQSVGDLLGLKQIGELAFSNCPKLEMLGDMPKLEVIGDAVFSECASLQSIGDMPELKEIGLNAFYGCSKLESIGKMPKVEVMGSAAFAGCSYLKSIGDLPELKEIGDWAFQSCGKLELIGEMLKVEVIGTDVFGECTSLQNIGDLPVLKEIGDRAFCRCEKLESIGNMPKLEVIGNSVFWECTSIQNIGDLSELKEIGDGAFYRCEKLESIGKMLKVETIGRVAFGGCNALDSIHFPSSLKGIGERVFVSVNLHKLIVEAPEPPTTNNSFLGLDCTKCQLVVPDNALEAYKSHPEWGKFLNIATLPGNSGINVPEDGGGVTIEAGDGMIRILSGMPVQSVIYNIEGRCVYNGNESVISGLPAGIYIVKIERAAFKVFVR